MSRRISFLLAAACNAPLPEASPSNSCISAAGRWARKLSRHRALLREQVSHDCGEFSLAIRTSALAHTGFTLGAAPMHTHCAPRSVAALFHIEGGDDAESCSCIRQARAAMIARYGSDAQHVLLLKHTPGANTAFVSSACATDQQSDQQGCVSIMPGVDSEWCATTCATSSCPENVCKNCPKADPAKAHSTFVEEVAKR